MNIDVKIDKANRLCNARFEITISKFVSVKKSVAKYEPIHHYFGNNLTTLANELYDKLKVCDWKHDDFIDAVHYGFYNNIHITFSSNYLDELYLHLEVKKNF